MLIPTQIMECSDEETVVTGNLSYVTTDDNNTEATAPITDDEYQSDSSFEQESSSEGEDILERVVQRGPQRVEMYLPQRVSAGQAK